MQLQTARNVVTSPSRCKAMTCFSAICINSLRRRAAGCSNVRLDSRNQPAVRHVHVMMAARALPALLIRVITEIDPRPFIDGCTPDWRSLPVPLVRLARIDAVFGRVAHHASSLDRWLKRLVTHATRAVVKPRSRIHRIFQLGGILAELLTSVRWLRSVRSGPP